MLEDPSDDGKAPRVVIGPCTLRHALTHLVELNGALRQSVLAALATFATGDDKQRLLTWATQKDQFQTHVKDACLTLPELLAQMPSLLPPVAVLLEVCRCGPFETAV